MYQPKREPEDIPELQDWQRYAGPEYWLFKLYDEGTPTEIREDTNLWLDRALEEEIDSLGGYQKLNQDGEEEEDREEDMGSEEEGDQGDGFRE